MVVEVEEEGIGWEVVVVEEVVTGKEVGGCGTEGGWKLGIALDKRNRSYIRRSARLFSDSWLVSSPTDLRTADVYFITSFFAGNCSM